ncbi:MAG: hypothetical protein M3N13_07060 [Candidatus Eremiobacteraeota bacterium]|nr:hypothetical protein [Candidatus Eremiobacteraeota bacterium]
MRLFPGAFFKSLQKVDASDLQGSTGSKLVRAKLREQGMATKASVSARFSARKRHIQLLSKEHAERVKAYKHGINLASQFGGDIEILISEACAARLKLANRFLRAAERELRQNPADHRRAISTSYYSMYHRLRAVVYYQNRGDDFEEHTALPKHLPGDFPAASHWSNEFGEWAPPPQ